MTQMRLTALGPLTALIVWEIAARGLSDAFVLAAPSGAALLDWHTWVIVAFCLVRAAPEARRKLFDREALRNGMRRPK